MIPIPNFRARASEWLEQDTRDTAFVLAVGALLVFLGLVAPPVWIADSLWMRFGLSLLLGEWTIRMYRWAKTIRQARIDRAEINALYYLLVRARDITELRHRVDDLLRARDMRRGAKPRRPKP